MTGAGSATAPTTNVPSQDNAAIDSDREEISTSVGDLQVFDRKIPRLAKALELHVVAAAVAADAVMAAAADVLMPAAAGALMPASAAGALTPGSAAAAPALAVARSVAVPLAAVALSVAVPLVAAAAVQEAAVVLEHS